MKSVFLFLIAIAGLITILSGHLAYSDITSNDKYVLQATGFLTSNQTILDSGIALQVTTGAQSGTTTQANLDNGVVTIAGTSYISYGPWQTSILRDAKYLVIVGDAQDQSGNVVHVNLFARNVDSNPNGSIYSISGKITGTQTMRVIFSAKVTSVNAFTSLPTTPTGTTPTGTTTQTPSQQGPTTVNISILPGSSNINNQQYFSQSSVNVLPGSTIIWTNNDSVPHRIASGVAKAIVKDQSTPIFQMDGKIDSGNLLPGQSYSYTITSFDSSQYLNEATASYLKLSPSATMGDISFFDPNYQWMVGVIGPAAPITTPLSSVPVSILPGASNPNNGQFFSPQSLHVLSGAQIIWTNNDSVPHRLLSGHPMSTTQGSAGASTMNAPQFNPDNNYDTGVIAPGQHYLLTITGASTIQFYDPQYTWVNMVIVSSQQGAQVTPVQISIQPGSSLSQGSATQQQFNQFNRYYFPATIQIVPGTLLVWTNNDSIDHTVLSGTLTKRLGQPNPFTPDGQIVSGKIAPGQSFQITINKTGIITFYDPQYTWMNGVIASLPPSNTKITGTQSGSFTGPTYGFGTH